MTDPTKAADDSGIVSLSDLSERNLKRRGGWRYQPVVTMPDGETVVTVIEVYVNEDGTLNGWTEDPAMVPQGNDNEDLSADLIRMLVDVWKWKPVAYSDLYVGMGFERTGVNIEGMIMAMNMARSSMS